MKVRASVKRLCESCKIVRRKNVVRVICKNPVTNRGRVESSRFQTGNFQISNSSTSCPDFLE